MDTNGRKERKEEGGEKVEVGRTHWGSSTEKHKGKVVT